jgi:hypothetical protein
MATRRTSFGKLQRDRAKQANQAAKRERRLERANAEPESIEIPDEGELSPAQLLELIEQIHKQFEANEIDFEEFEEKKLELMSRLPVD